jgi:hypothetical protein
MKRAILLRFLQNETLLDFGGINLTRAVEQTSGFAHCWRALKLRFCSVNFS